MTRILAALVALILLVGCHDAFAEIEGKRFGPSGDGVEDIVVADLTIRHRSVTDVLVTFDSGGVFIESHSRALLRPGTYRFEVFTDLPMRCYASGVSQGRRWTIQCPRVIR